jgi:hypothetical protein
VDPDQEAKMVLNGKIQYLNFEELDAIYARKTDPD